MINMSRESSSASIINLYILGLRTRHLWKGCKVLSFRFAENAMRHEVVRASMHVHIQDIDDRAAVIGPSDSLQIQISRMVKHGMSRLSTLEASSSVRITKEELSKGKWFELNVTRMVADWFRMPRDNLGAIVKVTDSSGFFLVPVPHSKADINSGMMPYLEVHLEDKSHLRKRRTVSMECQEDSKETRCCRYPLTVDFEQFGWDWIIAPKQYEANYCSGECPHAFFQKYPHTHIVHLASPPRGGGPCCAPRKLSAISMLYFDHQFNIIFGTLPGMVVEKCGCS